LNIAYFTDSYEPQINGVVTQINNMAKESLRKGHKFLIVAPSPDMNFKERYCHGVKVFLMPSIALPTYKDYRISYFRSEKILSEMKIFKPDVIHVHTPFGIGWLGVWVAKKLGVRLVGTYHTLIPDFLVYLPIPFFNQTNLAKKLAWKYTNWFYMNCDVLTTITNVTKKELEKNGLKKINVIPNSIDFEKFNKFKKKIYKSKGLKLIYFGRISYEKNIDVLILALEKLVSYEKNVYLTIVGSGPALESLKKLVEKKGLSERVSFLGAVGHDELPKIISQHDIFVTASTIETQGLTTIESMAIGLPCVAADARANSEMILHGKNGYLFKPFDAVDCAEKILLLESASKRRKFGLFGMRFVKRFSVEKVFASFLALYSKIQKNAESN
jgi:glycosyltransferase involved in cell wall biosynthesis